MTKFGWGIGIALWIIGIALLFLGVFTMRYDIFNGASFVALAFLLVFMGGFIIGEERYQ